MDLGYNLVSAGVRIQLVLLDLTPLGIIYWTFWLVKCSIVILTALEMALMVQD